MYPDHILQMIQPTLLMSLLLGTSCIWTATQNGHHRLETPTLLKVINIMYLGSYIFFLLNALFLSGQATFPNSGFTFQLIGQVLLTIVIYICALIINENVKTSLEDLTTIDTVLQALDQKMNYRQCFNYQLLGLFFGITLIFSIIFSEKFNDPVHSVPSVLWITFYFPLIIVFIMEWQFSMMVLLIYLRFKMVNQRIEEIYKTKTSYPKIRNDNVVTYVEEELLQKRTDRSIQIMLKKIETIAQVHDLLTDIAKHVNANYTIQLMPTLIIQFIIGVFSIFYIYYAKVIINQIITSINWILWVLLISVEILQVTIACHLACTQARLTGVEIHKLIMKSKDVEVKDRLMIFSQQVLQRQPQFTACGLFTIDATLLFTIVGSAATYLLIMIQFEEGGSGVNCGSNIIKNFTEIH